MPLEDLTGSDKYIGDLNAAWPLGSDSPSDGDNHLRGIKNVLRNWAAGYMDAPLAGQIPSLSAGNTFTQAQVAPGWALPSGGVFQDSGNFVALTFDANDGLAFERTTNEFALTINGVAALVGKVFGIWSPELSFGAMDAVLGDDTNGAWLAFAYNEDELYFNKTLHTFTFTLNTVDVMVMGDLAIEAKVPIDGVAPTAAAHLTRKDYVDAEVDAVSQAASVTVSGGSTLALSHQNKSVRVTSAGNITVPPNSSVAFPVGARLNIGNWSTGTVTIAPGSGVTLRSAEGLLALDTQYKGATLEKIGTNEWWVVGALA